MLLNFFPWFYFSFLRNNACKNAGFPEPAEAANAQILLFRKTKALFGKDAAREKTAFLHTLIVENKRETNEQK